MSYTSPPVTEPDTWVRVNIQELQSVNLKYIEDVDWKPGAVILWLCNGEGCEIADTHQSYRSIVEWLARHGERPRYGVPV